MAAWLWSLSVQAFRAVGLLRMARCDGETEERDKKELRILIIGKTGNGKSSVGNGILGRKIFEVGSSMSSTTHRVQTAQSDTNGCLVKVIDTPDPVNNDLTPKQFEAEVKTWNQMTAPAPSAILLAVRCDVRYTAEEYDIYKKIKAQWPRHEFCQRLVVAFTFADRQDKDIKEELKTVCWELKSVLKDASDRYVLFNNKDSETELKATVTQLLKIIDSMAADRGSLLSRIVSYFMCRKGTVIAIALLVYIVWSKLHGGNTTPSDVFPGHGGNTTPSDVFPGHGGNTTPSDVSPEISMRNDFMSRFPR